MSSTNIINTFYRISESIGLPPIVLIFAIALFTFIIILALIVLIKVRSIRIALLDVNRSLEILHQRIQVEIAILREAKLKLIRDSEKLKFESQNQAADKSVENSSFGLRSVSQNEGQNSSQSEDGSNYQREDLTDSREEKPDLCNEILNLLKETGRPTSYSEIVKYFPRDSYNYDFDVILDNLEKLKTEGKISGQVSAGKLYFKINLKKIAP